MDLRNERSDKNFVSVQHLEKVYANGAKAVYDFDLDIDRHDFIVIVGPSGCGKTTTLRMIAGLEDVSAGNIFIDSECVNYKPSKDRKIAIVFQSYALYPQMSVYDNIAFPLSINKYPFPAVESKLRELTEAYNVEKAIAPALIQKTISSCSSQVTKRLTLADLVGIKYGMGDAGAERLVKDYDTRSPRSQEELVGTLAGEIKDEETRLKDKGESWNGKFERLDETGKVILENRKMSKREIRTKVFEAATILDLGPYLDRLPKELSGGQMQRVALGRAIVKNVPLFLMDEPLSNLDAKLRLTMRSEIVKLHRKIGATTIYVTHDQTEAMTMATKIVVMSKGFIQQIGDPQSIYDDPCNLFVARFLGSPSINVFDGGFNQKETIVLSDELNIDLGPSFKKAHDAFYKAKLAEFLAAYSSYGEDPKSKEFILKILSGIGGKPAALVGMRKKSKWESLFKKKAVAVDSAKEAFEEKISLLKKALTEEHPIACAIRPERMEIKLREKGKQYKNCYFVSPTVCEALGNEYIVHFDFLGEDMTAKMDSKSHVNLESELVLSFSKDDLLFFDPITGSRIHF